MKLKGIRRSLLAASAIVSVGALAAVEAQATLGQLLHCTGVSNCGVGGAGGAMAMDAASAINNPALAVDVGTEASFSAGWFSADVEATVNGNHGGQHRKLTSDASNFATGAMAANYRINPDFAVNISAFPSAGGETNYDASRVASNVQAGAGTVEQGDSQIRWREMDVQIATAWRPRKDFAIGFGAIASRTDMKTDALDNTFASPINGTSSSVDAVYGGGFQLGVTWKATDMLTVGADYRSQVWLSRFSHYNNTFNGPINRPPTVRLSANFQVSPQTNLLFDALHIEQTAVEAISTDPAANGGFGWKNRIAMMVGIQHKIDNLSLRFGWSYAESPIEKTHVFANVLLPAVTEHHFSAGLGCQIFDGMSVGMSAYWAPEVSVTDCGCGDSFSTNNPDTTIEMGQYGTQLSVNYKF